MQKLTNEMHTGDIVIVHFNGQTLHGQIKSIGYCYGGEHMVKIDNGKIMFLQEQILEKDVHNERAIKSSKLLR